MTQFIVIVSKFIKHICNSFWLKVYLSIFWCGRCLSFCLCIWCIFVSGVFVSGVCMYFLFVSNCWELKELEIRARDLAQWCECLPGKSWVQSLSTRKKKKKEKEVRQRDRGRSRRSYKWTEENSPTLYKLYGSEGWGVGRAHIHGSWKKKV